MPAAHCFERKAKLLKWHSRANTRLPSRFTVTQAPKSWEQFRRRPYSMVVVGGGLALTAIAVFFAWRLVKTSQAMWRERAVKKNRLAGKQ